MNKKPKTLVVTISKKKALQGHVVSILEAEGFNLHQPIHIRKDPKTGSATYTQEVIRD